MTNFFSFSLVRRFASLAAVVACFFAPTQAEAYLTITQSLSTDIWNEGNAAPAQYASGYNNNGTNSTVELTSFIGNSVAAPLNVAYNQGGSLLDVSPWVTSGSARTTQPMKVNGYNDLTTVPTVGQNLFLRDQPNVPNEGFGAHANWIVTFDLDDIRDVHFGGLSSALQLSGEFGAWGLIGSVDPTAGMAQGVVFLDGVRIDSMSETIANPAAVNQSFNLTIGSGRWLTFGIFNGDGTADSSLWDDALYQNVQLTMNVVPEPGTGLLLVVGLVALAQRRRRSTATRRSDLASEARS